MLLTRPSKIVDLHNEILGIHNISKVEAQDKKQYQDEGLCIMRESEKQKSFTLEVVVTSKEGLRYAIFSQST